MSLYGLGVQTLTCSKGTDLTWIVKPISAGPRSLCWTMSLTGICFGDLMELSQMVLRQTVIPEKHETGGMAWWGPWGIDTCTTSKPMR